MNDSEITSLSREYAEESAKECRLNIAATIMAGVLTNPNIIKSRSEFKSISENWLASRSLEFADALIAECDSPIN